MNCNIYPLGALEHYLFVVVLSKYRGNLLLSRHRKRMTWETQGGHIELGETPLDAAKRELYEESGAVKYSIEPAFDYCVNDGEITSNGMVFVAEIEEMGALPESEICEISLFAQLPEKLTYPEITPVLLKTAMDLKW